MSNQNSPAVSVVIPTRNEEANIVQMAAAIVEQMEKTRETFELIFIDNASDDRTVELGRDLCANDPRIRLIINARNFGQMRSPTHGIFVARGKAVVNLCADFQDPPELIPAFVEKWRAGTDIILGVRQSEKSSFILGKIRKISYWFAGRFGDYPVVQNATGFGLYDRKVVEAIRRLNEPEPFFRGMLAETGYSMETISYPRPQRAGGKSNNNFFALLDFALSALAGASKRFVRVPFFVGAIALIASAAALPLALLSWLVGGSVSPWLWLALFEFHFGLLFVFVGVVGDQIRLISERTRQTPLVTERERVNFPEDH